MICDPEAKRTRGPFCPECGSLLLATQASTEPVCSANPFGHLIPAGLHKDAGCVEPNRKGLGSLLKPYPTWTAWEKRHAGCMQVVMKTKPDGTPVYNCLWQEYASKPAPRRRLPGRPAVSPETALLARYGDACRLLVEGGIMPLPFAKWRANVMAAQR